MATIERRVDEDGDPLTYTFTFDDFGFIEDVVLDWDVTDLSFSGSATNNLDYTFSHQLTNAGLEVTFTPISDTEDEGDEVATISVTGFIDWAGPGSNGSFHSNVNGDIIFGVKTRENISESIDIVIVEEENKDPVIHNERAEAEIVIDSDASGLFSFSLQASGTIDAHDPDKTDVVTFDSSPDPRLQLADDGSFTFTSTHCILGDNSSTSADLEIPITVTDDEGSQASGWLHILLPTPEEMDLAKAPLEEGLLEAQKELFRIESDIAEIQSLDAVRGRLSDTIDDLAFLQGVSLAAHGAGEIDLLFTALNLYVSATGLLVEVAPNPTNEELFIGAADALQDLAAAIENGEPLDQDGNLGIFEEAATLLFDALSPPDLIPLDELMDKYVDMFHFVEERQFSILDAYSPDGTPFFDIDSAVSALLSERDKVNDRLAIITESLEYFENCHVELMAGPGDDRLAGRGGDDILNGGADNDVMIGAAGADELLGGPGDDVLKGGPGNDLLKAGVGADVLRGSNGKDNLIGDAGDDRMFGGPGDDLLKGSPGADVQKGGGGEDVLRGGGGEDVLRGGVGNDKLLGGGGDDRMFGGPGDDVLRGSPGADVLKGGGGEDVLRGGGDNDRLIGGFGNDMLFGGGGDDRMFGGGGNDVLDGGSGNDVLFGGAGADRFVVGLNAGTNRIKDFKDNIDSIDLTGFGFATVQEAKSFASNVTGGVVFDFSGGEQLIVEDVALAQLTGLDILV